MPKNQRKQVVYCVEHEFSLTPLRDDVHLKQPATLSFCKGKLESKARGKQQKKNCQQICACCPIFNKDNNYATSSFILPEEQQNFIENSQKLKLEHQHRVYDYNEEKSNMFVPKPKSKYSYCSTCRANYDDYLDHVTSQSHKNNANKSKFSHYIKDLQKRYERKNKSKISQSKNYEGSSATNYLSQTDICVQQLGRPSKKVKISQQPCENYNNIKFSSPFQSLPPFQALPLSNFSPNMIYQNCQQFRPPTQLFSNGIGAGFSQLPFGYQMFNPYMYWNPYHDIFNNMNLNMGMGVGMNINNMPLGVSMEMYNSCKPIVIDLEVDNK